MAQKVERMGLRHLSARSRWTKGVGLVFLLSLISITLVSCSLNNALTGSTTSGNKIEGEVAPLNTSQSSALNCVAPYVSLQEFGSNQWTEVATSTVDSTGKFKLGSRAKFNDKPLKLVLLNCDVVLEKIVTSSSAQKISFTSDLLIWKKPESLTQPWASVVNQISQLESSLALKADYTASFNELTSSSQSSTLFANIYGAAPIALNSTPPKNLKIVAPSTISEESSSVFTATYQHWNSLYNPKYEWSVDGVVVGSSAALNYSFSANAQGSHSVGVKIGLDNGSGGFVAHSISTHSVNVLVANSLPAVAPALTLTSPALTSSPTITVDLQSGSARVNCKTFSNFGFTINSSSPPAASSFTGVCTSPNTQSETLTLPSTDGTYVVRLWTRDSSGLISSSPSQVTVQLDTTPPSLSILSPSVGSRFDTEVTLTGLCEAGLLVQVSGELLSSTSVLCSAGTYSITRDLSNGDGNKTIQVTQTDSAGLTTTASVTVVNDTLAPALALSSPAALTPFRSSFVVSGTCGTADGDLPQLTVSGDLSFSPATVNCTAGSYSFTVSPTGSDGIKWVHVSQSDSAGALVLVSRNFVQDQTPPALTVTAPIASTAMNSSTLSVSGTCEDGTTLTLSGDLATSYSPTCSASSFTQTVTLTVGQGSKTISISSQDAAGNTTSLNRSIIYDTTPPTLTASQFTVNGGSNQTANFLKLNLAATDTYSNVSSVCLKYVTSVSSAPGAPAMNDSCWSLIAVAPISVTPSLNVTLSNLDYRIGFTPTSYSIYAWVQDAAGNISSITAGGTLNRDRIDINYSPVAPPTVSNVIANNSDAVTIPPSLADSQSASGSNLFIKWKVSSAAGLTAQPITIYYSPDASNYSILASNLTNGANGSCTLNGDFTGCYRLPAGSPSSAFMNFRVEATDVNLASNFATSNPVNAGQFRIVAGNTAQGIDGSAQSAIYLKKVPTYINTQHRLAVADDGEFFIYDHDYGLLSISPSTGKLQVVLYHGTTSVDGPSSTARIRYIYRMALGYDKKLYFIDRGLIRSLDLVTRAVTTIIGGGSSKADNIAPTDLQVEDFSAYDPVASVQLPLVPLPNGDILFMSEKGPSASTSIRRYVKSTNRVNILGQPTGSGLYTLPSENFDTLQLWGFGVVYDSSSNIQHLLGTHLKQYTYDTHYLKSKLNPTTLQSLNTPPGYPANQGYYDTLFNSRRGELYSFNVHNSILYKYDHSANYFNPVLGNGLKGTCADGTSALSCPVDLDSVFIASDDTIYYISKGQIRYVNPTDNKVYSLFGESQSSGDGGLAVNSRIFNMSKFDHFNNNMVFFDESGMHLRKIDLNTGMISRLVGIEYSSQTTLPAANGQIPLYGIDSLGMTPLINPYTEDIYFQTLSSWTHVVAKYDHTTGAVSKVLGGGGTNYFSNDGLSTANTQTPYYGYDIKGFSSATTLIASQYNHNGVTFEHNRTVSYDLGGVQTYLFGNGTLGSIGADGTSVLASPSEYPFYQEFKWSAANSYWYFMANNYSTLRTITPGGNIGSVADVGMPMGSFEVVEKSASEKVIYFCNPSDGNLYKYNTLTTTRTQLSKPSYYQCWSKGLKYNATRGSLLFAGQRFGLFFIGEVYDTP